MTNGYTMDIKILLVFIEKKKYFEQNKRYIEYN